MLSSRRRGRVWISAEDAGGGLPRRGARISRGMPGWPPESAGARDGPAGAGPRGVMSEHARRSPAEPVIVARDAERGLLSGFLDPGARAGAAVLTGPAGIGKAALWEWAVAQASAAGYLVLASRAGIAEARLPWVGL